MFLDIKKNKVYKPIVLLILDGWGLAPAWGGNAISIANTRNFDNLWLHYPHTELCSSGTCVGLPGHEVGNSEVGHLNLGAGRKLSLDIAHINKAIEDKSFFENKILLKLINSAQNKNSKIHLLGLLSDGGVHSHISHLFALLELIKIKKAKNVYLHLILDGRDTPQYQALIYLEKLIDKINNLGLNEEVKIATVSGRYYAMDRDKHWERIKLYYDCITKAAAPKFKSPERAISFAYRNGLYDETIPPGVINRQGIIEDNDSIIFYNFRSDRAQELSEVLSGNNFQKFKREKINNLLLASFVPYFEYGADINAFFPFQSRPLQKTLAETISSAGLTQIHLAETEKYAHVTYFFNGGAPKRFDLEDDILVSSPRVSSYDQIPQMSIYAVTKTLNKAISTQKYKFAVVNFANCDMVGHTGNFDKVVEAIGHVDKCLGDVYQIVKKYSGSLLVTADHGNAEEMVKPDTGGINPEHTNNPVPFIFVDTDKQKKKIDFSEKKNLNNVAPTILELLKLSPPKEMNCQALFKDN